MATVQEVNDSVNGSAYGTSTAQPHASPTLARVQPPAARFIPAVKPTQEASPSLGPLTTKAPSKVSDQSRLAQLPSRLPPPKSTSRLSRWPSRLSSPSPSLSIIDTEGANTIEPIVTQGGADPKPSPPPSSSTAEQLLTRTLSRLFNIRSEVQEQHHTISTPVLEDPLVEDDEAKDSLDAWKEAEGKTSAEEKEAREAACKAWAKDLMSALRNMMGEARTEGVGYSVKGAGMRMKRETDEQDDGSTSPSLSTGAPSSPPSGDHRRIAELESKVASLQSQVEAHQASRNSLQAKLKGLAERVKADVTATFESRIAALEARGSPSASNSMTSTSTSP